MKRHLITAVVLLLSCCHVFGQISTDEEPVSYRMHIPALQRSESAQKVMPPLDVNKLEQEDIKDEANGIPPRFGFPYEVNYNLDNSGEWTVLSDGSRIWRLVISCPNALSINLLYDKFRLPEGAKFFIYSSDRKHSIGAFTSVNNKGNEKDIQGFATGLIYGDQVTLEYWLPNDVKETGVISIAYVVHGYRYIQLSDNDNETRSYGESMSCNININCSQGQNWQNEKNAVAMILVNGTRVCTGSLVNTTANDNRPLFLTADHCLGSADAISNSNLSYWSFYWHYESPGCANILPPQIRSTSGATLVANNSISDFALLRLTEDPRNKTGVTPYYLGWDRSSNASTGGVGIHHPKGDIKKISQSNQIQNNPYQITWSNSYGVPVSTTPPNSHWDATFFNGLIENGSSGSPLINNDRRIVGQLHGGLDAYCNTSYVKRYGKFNVSWTGAVNNTTPDNRRKLQPWLDPVGTNPTTLDGKGFTRPTLTGPTLVLNSGSAYTLSNTNGGSVTWSCSSNLYKISGSGASATFGALYPVSDGSGWIQATVNGSPVRHEVWVGRPVITGIGGDRYPYTSEDYEYGAIYNENAGVAYYSGFQWTLSPSNGYIYDSSGSPYIRFNNTGSCQLLVRATNANGVGEYCSITLYVSDGYSPSSSSSALYQVYPNPASDELTVSLRTQLSSAPIQSSGGSNTVGNKVYTVYLYNANGASVRQAVSQGGQVQLDVSGLPDGIYYLVIDSGNGSNPETHKIVVKH